MADRGFFLRVCSMYASIPPTVDGSPGTQGSSMPKKKAGRRPERPRLPDVILPSLRQARTHFADMRRRQEAINRHLGHIDEVLETAVKALTLYARET